MNSRLQATVLSSVVGLSVIATAVVTFLETDFAATGKSPLGGQYQRTVEARFTDNIPYRDLSIHGWSAMKLWLFGQTNSGAIIADSGRMFTSEEVIDVTTQFDFHTEVSAAKSTLDQRNIALVAVVVPDKTRIYVQDLPFERPAMMADRYDQILTTLKSLAVPAVDLRQSLIEGQNLQDVFMWTDTHWSPGGAQIAAQQTAQAINKDFEFEKSEFTTSAVLTQDFDGDLISFAETGPFRKWVGPRRETITTYSTEVVVQSDDLFGDIEVPLALVGTSFSARTEFHFAGFLKQHTGLDLINYAQSGRGPFEPMREFLSSEALKTSPPKLVIWEIPERYIPVKEAS